MHEVFIVMKIKLSIAAYNQMKLRSGFDQFLILIKVILYVNMFFNKVSNMTFEVLGSVSRSRVKLRGN